MKKMNTRKKVLLVIGIVVILVLLCWMLTGVFAIGVMYFAAKSAEVEVSGTP